MELSQACRFSRRVASTMELEELESMAEDRSTALGLEGHKQASEVCQSYHLQGKLMR